MTVEALAPATVENFLNRIEEVDSSGDAAHSFLEIAAAWRSAGIRPGDVILLCLPNGLAAVRQFFGALFSGAVPAMLGLNTPVARLRELAAAIGARGIITPRPHGGVFARSHAAQLGEAYAEISDGLAPPAAAPGEVIMLTSGTSGFASGCVFDVGALLLNAQRHALSIGQRREDIVLMNLPMHFSFALVAQMLASMVCGNRLVIGGPPFHGPSYRTALARFGITISSLTPVLVRRILEQAADLPAALRVLSVGGDYLAVEQTEALLRARPRGELYLTYGLTQAGPRVSTLAAHAEPASRHGSVGRPLSGTRVHLEPLPEQGDLKQLFVSSATVMKRRIGLSEGVRQAAVAAERCIATGDIFEEDSEGYLYHRGRVSDFIVRNGEKICLAAVRRVAAQLPHVMRVQTIVSRHDYGEDFELILHMAADSENDVTGDLRKWLRQSEMPRGVKKIGVKESPVAAYK